MAYSDFVNNSFVYSENYGFGICFSEREGRTPCDAFFEDGEIHKVIPPFYNYGHNVSDLADYAFSVCRGMGEYEKRRAESYIASGYVSLQKCDIDKLNVSFTCGAGAGAYKVGIEFFYSLRLVCGCKAPNCVHKAAVCLYLARRFGDLEELYIRSEKNVPKDLFVPYRVRSAITATFAKRNPAETAEAVKTAVGLVAGCPSPDFVRKVFGYIVSLQDGVWGKTCDCIGWITAGLCDHPVIGKMIPGEEFFAPPQGSFVSANERSNRKAAKKYTAAYRAASAAVAAGRTEQDGYAEFLLYLRDDRRKLVRLFADGKTELSESDAAIVCEFVADGMTEDDGEAAAKAAVRIENSIRGTAAEKMIRTVASAVSPALAAEIAGNVRGAYFGKDFIAGLPESARKTAAFRSDMSQETIRYVLGNVLDGDREKLLYIIRYIVSCRDSCPYSFASFIMSQIDSVPHSALVRRMAALKGICPNTAANTPEVGREDIAVCFSADFKVVCEDGFCAVYYTLSPADDPLYPVAEIRECDGNAVFTLNPYRLTRARHAGIIKELAVKGREDEFAARTEEFEEAATAERFFEDHPRFAEDFRRFSEKNSESEILLTQDNRVSFEYDIYSDFCGEGKTEYFLALKTGVKKKYIVKNIAAFYEAFRNNETVKYGKDLILTHNSDNVADGDRPALDLLLSAGYVPQSADQWTFRDSRYTRLSPQTLFRLCGLLKGRTVRFNETPCFLRMDRVPLTVRVADDWTISLAGIDAGTEFFNLGGNALLLTRAEETVLNYVSGTAGEIRLFELAGNNSGTAIKPILNKFKKNIYSYFPDKFDIAPSLRDAFRLSGMKINAYFDYDGDGFITVRTEYVKDGTVIPASAVTDRADMIKLGNFAASLESLGFANGVMKDDSDILSFLKMDFSNLRRQANVYISDELGCKQVCRVGKQIVSVTRLQSNIMQAFLEPGDYTREELAQILAGLKRKKKFILLGRDRIVDLTDEDARDFAETVADLGLDPKALHEKKRISMVTALKALAHEKNCRADRYLKQMIEDIRGYKESGQTVPVIRGDLRPYQTEGFRWLSVLASYGMGGILADDMGLGKTVQVIALLKSDSTPKPSVIVCPKSLVFNWLSEFAKFDGETEVVGIYGSAPDRAAAIGNIDYGRKTVYITSYDSLRNDIQLFTGEFNYGILDEAQYIKNVNALKSKSVKELNIVHRFALTGTPIENNLGDLWSIFDYIMPGYLDELKNFARKTDGDGEQTALIAKKVAPFILRRIKADVLTDLPEKYERVLTCEMDADQRKVYEAYKMKANEILAGGNAFDVLPFIMRLRQICVDPSLAAENYAGGSGKLTMLGELVSEYLENGHRILIFSQFVTALGRVENILRRNGIRFFRLTGETSMKERARMIDDFNNGGDADVFLISLKAGGTGLNLTGADTVIHLDPWWNVAAENQASDRAHRIGQTRNVEVIRLIAENSIEQRVIELQNAKKDLIGKVISDDDSSVTNASAEDIAFILS